MKNPANLVVCAANSTNTNTGIYQRPATGIGQLRALVLATRSLYRAYHKRVNIQNILLSSEPLQDRLEDDLLILGGPKNNVLAAKYLDLLHDEQPVRFIGNMIIWRTNRSGGHRLDQGAIESALCVLCHAAFKTRWRRSGKPPRPYMERFIYFSLLIFPSTGPFERTVNYT